MGAGETRRLVVETGWTAKVGVPSDIETEKKFLLLSTSLPIALQVSQGLVPGNPASPKPRPSKHREVRPQAAAGFYFTGSGPEGAVEADLILAELPRFTLNRN